MPLLTPWEIATPPNARPGLRGGIGAGLLAAEEIVNGHATLFGALTVPLDLNIPGLDGFEVTLRLRTEASLNGVPIIAITAEGDRDTSLNDHL